MDDLEPVDDALSDEEVLQRLSAAWNECRLSDIVNLVEPNR